MRLLHYFAIGVHLGGLLLFAYAYSRVPSAVFVFFMGWCCFYGALSVAALRKGKRA